MAYFKKQKLTNQPFMSLNHEIHWLYGMSCDANELSISPGSQHFVYLICVRPPPRNFLHSSSTMRLPYGHITAERIGKSSPAQVDKYLKRCIKTRKDSVLLETYQRHLIKKKPIEIFHEGLESWGSQWVTRVLRRSHIFRIHYKLKELSGVQGESVFGIQLLLQCEVRAKLRFATSCVHRIMTSWLARFFIKHSKSNMANIHQTELIIKITTRIHSIRN